MADQNSSIAMNISWDGNLIPSLKPKKQFHGDHIALGPTAAESKILLSTQTGSQISPSSQKGILALTGFTEQDTTSSKSIKSMKAIKKQDKKDQKAIKRQIRSDVREKVYRDLELDSKLDELMMNYPKLIRTCPKNLLKLHSKK